MKVSHVWVNKYESGKLLGFADVQFSLREDGDGVLTIRGFKIFKSDEGGITVALPSRKDDKGEYRPLVSLEKENKDGIDFLNHITDRVASAFHNLKEKKEAAPISSSSEHINDDPNPSGIPF